jgi:ABC-type spermidine/putrescine transport system permease subunit II
MDVTQDSRIQVLRDRQDALRSLFLIQQRLVFLALLVATLVAPLTAITESPDSDDPTIESRGLFASIGYFFDNDAEAFGDRETHPHGLDAGLVTSRIGLVLLLIAVLCAIVASLAFWAGQSRGAKPTQVVLGIVLIIAAGLVFLGLTWLPDSDQGTSATSWLWLPIAAGMWSFYQVWSSKRLD